MKNAAGTDLASVDGDGVVRAAAVRGVAHAADPSFRTDGDSWYNATRQARRTMEGGQVHGQPQVICTLFGMGVGSTTPTTLGTCTIPASLLQTGDRFEVRADFTHDGAASDFSYRLTWGSVVMVERSSAALETNGVVRLEVLPAGTLLFWSRQTWGAVAGPEMGAGTATGVPAGDKTVTVTAFLNSASSDLVSLRNLSVVRYPNQSNP